MKLQEFLTKSGMSHRQFAEEIGTAQATVSRLCSGAALPSLKLAHEIETVTNGAVPAWTFVPGFVPPKKRGRARQSAQVD